MNRNTNWGYLPDYSHQNHTLKFSRKASGLDSYHSADDRIPPSAWFGAAAFVIALVAVLWLGHIAGF